MTFEKLHADTNCNCISDSQDGKELIFARKIKKPALSLKDFSSHWERGIRPKELTDCLRVCIFKGLSINCWNDESKILVIEKYLTTFRFAPKHRNYILVFRLSENAGFCKSTPTEKDPFHFTFFKSDEFSLNLMEVLEIIPLEKHEP